MSTYQVDNITDAAGTGAPNLTNGAKLAGGSDVLDHYEEVSISGASGDWSTADMKIVRIGSVVTLSATANWFVTDNTDTTQDTLAIIPVGMRPAVTQFYNYNGGVVNHRLTILPSGGCEIN